MESFEKKILMIDDDLEDQEIFNQIVRQIDPSIVCLQPASASLALDLLLHDKFIPHYIFLDLNMPIMNGFEFLRAIKQHAHLGHIPVIVYTTSNQIEDKEKAMRLGADGFLTKESSMRELQTSLSRLLLFDRTADVNASQ